MAMSRKHFVSLAKTNTAALSRRALRRLSNSEMTHSNVHATTANPVTQHQIYDLDKHRPKSTASEITIAILTSALLFTAVVTGAVAWWQWELGRDQLSLAQKQFRHTQTEAVEAADETRQALQIASRSADAAEAQAVITKQSLLITDRLAAANLQQANALDVSAELARRSLAFEQTSYVDLQAFIDGYALGQSPIALVQITNVGGKASIFARTSWHFELTDINDTPSKWSDNFSGQTTVSVPPGGQRIKPIQGAAPLDEAQIRALSEERAKLLISAVVEYRDATGSMKKAYLCYEWHGPPPNPTGHFCDIPRTE